MVTNSSVAMPKLSERKAKLNTWARTKLIPAVIRVGPPPVSLLLTVKLVTALIVGVGGAGWQRGGKREEEKLKHFPMCVRSSWLLSWVMVKRKVRRVLLLQHYIPEDKECVIHWNAVCWSWMGLNLSWNFYRTQVSLVRSMGLVVSHWLSHLCKLNWCDSGWWRNKLNTNW